MLKAVGARHILARMLRNLKNIYLERRRLAARARRRSIASCCSSRARLDDLLERGALYERLECFSAALDDFQSFLRQAPEHPAAETAREAVCG